MGFKNIKKNVGKTMVSTIHWDFFQIPKFYFISIIYLKDVFATCLRCCQSKTLLQHLDSSWPTKTGRAPGCSTTVDAPEIRRSPVEVGSWNPIIYDGFCTSHVVVWDFWTINSSMMTSWWFQPIWKIFVKLDRFPRDKHENCLKPASLPVISISWI